MIKFNTMLIKNRKLKQALALLIERLTEDFNNNKDIFFIP